MENLIAELKRRRVFQVVVAYALVSWVLAQIIDVLNDPLNLPPWFATVAIVLLGIGFPIAVLLAWAYDLTPAGVIRTPDVTRDPEPQSTEPSGRNSSRVMENSVAVLPFENLSPNQENAYFASGIHGEILTQLAKIRALNVIGRTSVLPFADGSMTVTEIARALNVENVMEGTVRYAGNRVRITAQLISAASNTQLWSESYDRDMQDIFAIQTDIATRIANALAVGISKVEQKSIQRQPTRSASSYDLFLQAMTIYREGDRSVGASAGPEKRAIIQDRLDQALALDPEFAVAHAWKAWLYAYSRAYDPIAEEDWLSRSNELDERAQAHARIALGIDANIGLAEAAIGRVSLYRGQISDAQSALERARLMSPNDAEVLRWCANIMWFGERHADALEIARRGVTLDPSNSLYYDLLGRLFHSAKDYQAATEAFRKVISIKSGTSIDYLSAARPELALGNSEAALHAVKTADKLLPEAASPALFADLAYGYGRLRKPADAARAFRRLEEISATRYVDPAVWTFAHLGLGNQDQAKACLARIAENRELIASPFTVKFIRENAWLDPELQQPEFEQLRDRLAFNC